MDSGCRCSSKPANTYLSNILVQATRGTLAQVTIDGSHLTLDQVLQVARDKARTVITEKAIARTRNGRKALEELLRKKEVIYGVNTGFGALSNFTVASEGLKQLQTNLIRSHSANVGQPHSPEVVRAMMLLRANTLLARESRRLKSSHHPNTLYLPTRRFSDLKALEELLRKKEVIYGVNTGFGALSNFTVASEDLKQLQTNLIRSHSANVGQPHSPEVVRAMMLLRANTLLDRKSVV